MLMCDLDSGVCVNRDDAALREAAAAAAAATAPSAAPPASCGAVERAECYDKCSPTTRKSVLQCSFCCLDCEATRSCARVASGGGRHVTGPLFRPTTIK
jgi:hypothetical protein